MQRFILLGVVIVLVGLPLTLLTLREFQDDPTIPLHDLRRSVTGALRKSPGVANIEVDRILKPTHRIVHIRDRHLIPKERFAAELQKSAAGPLSDEETLRRYQDHVDQIDALQQEQMELLRSLVKDHAVKQVRAEGLSAPDLPAYLEKIATLKALDGNQIATLRDRLQQVRAALAEEPSPKLQAIETLLLGKLAEFRVELIEMGAAGRLLVSGEIEEVLPLEGADAVRREAADSGQRLDSLVETILKDGALSVILLNGELNLSDRVKRFGQGKCEYIRVTTQRYLEFVEPPP